MSVFVNVHDDQSMSAGDHEYLQQIWWDVTFFDHFPETKALIRTVEGSIGQQDLWESFFGDRGFCMYFMAILFWFKASGRWSERLTLKPPSQLLTSTLINIRTLKRVTNMFEEENKTN